MDGTVVNRRNAFHYPYPHAIKKFDAQKGKTRFVRLLPFHRRTSSASCGEICAGLGHGQDDAEMSQKQKNDDKPQQSSTL
jgi:hypothetical protein